MIVLATATLQREAWRALLSQQPYIAVAGTACEVSVAGALIETGQPTTVVVDLPGQEIETARQLGAAALNAGSLFLLDRYDLETVLALLKAGATGCLSRDASVAELARAVIATGRGEISLPQAIAGRALVALASGEPHPSGLVESLTEREAEVLGLLAQGMTNKDIAQTLIISVRTVEAHLRNLYGKLGVGSRTEAALWAVKNGYGEGIR